MRTVERPNTRAKLRQHTGDDAEGYATVVGAISFFDAVGDTRDEFERRFCGSVVGESEGIHAPAVLEDMGSGD